MLESYSYSFSNEEKNKKALLSDEIQSVQIVNAVSCEFTLMRKSIAPNLFAIASENQKHTEVFAFFEIGKIHEKHAENDFSESLSVAGITSGKSIKDFRIGLENVLHKLLPSESLIVKQSIVSGEFPFFHPGKSGRYETENGVVLAVFGSLHPEVLENFGLSDDTLYFEIDAAVFLALYDAAKEPVFKEFSKFQVLGRELNFVLEDTVSTGEIAQKIAAIDPRIKSVYVKDIYRDAIKIGQSKKSVTFSFRIEDMEKTLEDSETLMIQDSIISHLEKSGYSLRK